MKISQIKISTIDMEKIKILNVKLRFSYLHKNVMTYILVNFFQGIF